MSAAPTARRIRRLTLLRGPVAALCFLTRLPVGRWVEVDGDDMTRSGPAFPLVGAGIGAVVGSLAAALTTRLSPLLAVALALAASALLTGALHLDALADTADALGTHSRARALEVMRDSTIGAFGASAIGLDLLLKAGALTALVHDHRAVRVAVATGALSRLVPVLLAAALPYARAGEGAGVALTRGGPVGAVLATVVASAFAVGLAGADGAAMVGFTAALTVVLWLACRRWLGGVTGDALGAALEVTETGGLVLAVALVGGHA